MPLGMEVCLSSGDFVLDEDPGCLHTKEQSPRIFVPRLLWPNGCMDQDATWYGGRPRSMRLRSMVTQLPQKKGYPPTANFWPMSVVAKRLDGSRCHLVRR